MGMSTTAEIRRTSSTGSNFVNDATSRVPIRTLNQDDFFKLLVTQMTQQDPMNPKTDTEFIGQLAQFSALEQSKAMQSDIARLRAEQQFAQANGMIGQAVRLKDSDGNPVEGIVSGVTLEKGVSKILVNDRPYDLSQVVSATLDPRAGYKGELSQASALVGRNVQVRSADGTLQMGTVTGLRIVDQRPRLIVEGQEFDLGQIVSVASGPDMLSAEFARLRTQEQFLQANALVGRTVELQVDQDNTVTGVVSGVKLVAGTPKIVVRGQPYDLSQLLGVGSTTDLVNN
jgi:flagellar basal-body rod modification protein FlgD